MCGLHYQIAEWKINSGEYDMLYLIIICLHVLFANSVTTLSAYYINRLSDLF